MKRTVLLLVGSLLWIPAVGAQGNLEIEIKGASSASKDIPVSVPLSIPNAWGDSVTITLPSGQSIAGQLTSPGIQTDEIAPSMPNLKRFDLHFILPQLDAAQTLLVKAKFDSTKPATNFVWKDQPNDFSELYRGGKPVLRYMYKTYNEAKDQRDLTYKVFHHLYDPSGKGFVTNGGHTDPGAMEKGKKLTFPHHRGLMYGFNKITYDGKKTADTWHCTKDAHISHEKFLGTEAGPVLGRHRVLLDWYGSKTDIFAKEERELTVYNVAGGILVEFASRLKTTDGKVHIDGDPQHAGFQFRASNDVADKTAKQTYYLDPNRKGAPGETHNWDPKGKDDGMVNLPWYAMSFVLGENRYTACYLNHPSNPRPSRFSERDYGRFGGYFEYDLTTKTPLLVDYRLWLQDGEMTADQTRALYQGFATPPQAKVINR